jgi:phage shock protein A
MRLINSMTQLRFFKSNGRIKKDEDPELYLDQVVIDMCENLVQLRQRHVSSSVCRRRIEQQYNEAIFCETEYLNKAWLAFDQDKLLIALDYLERKIYYTKLIAKIKVQLKFQEKKVSSLKDTLTQQERKICMFKIRHNMLRSRLEVAKVKIRLQETLAQINTSLVDLTSKNKNQSKLLEEFLADMREDLQQLRRVLSNATSNQQHIIFQYHRIVQDAINWHLEYELSLSKGDKDLAITALAQRKYFSDIAILLEEINYNQFMQVVMLKYYLIQSQGKYDKLRITIRNLIQDS